MADAHNSTSAEIRAEMVRLYVQGANYEEAARPFGLSTKASRNAVIAAGITPRKGGGTRGKPLKDMTGKTFGRLTVIGVSGKRSDKVLKWDCRCECGGSAVVNCSKLLNGHTQSCGCLRVDVHRKIMEDERGPLNHPLRSVWATMKARCHNENASNWSNYGGRGITVCSGIRDSFKYFISVVGDRPRPGMTFDRKDNDKGYWCGACDECRANNRDLNIQWATRRDQMNNTRASIKIEHNGESMSLGEWAIRSGINYDALHQRLTNGWSVERAITTPMATPKNTRKRSAESRLRAIWNNMIRRCHNEKCREYKWYGAKGVFVCNQWRNSFDQFAADVGPRPSDIHSLDRFPNPAGNYEPENVRWATKAEQMGNLRGDRAKPDRTIPRRIVVD